MEIPWIDLSIAVDTTLDHTVTAKRTDDNGNVVVIDLTTNLVTFTIYDTSAVEVFAKPLDVPSPTNGKANLKIVYSELNAIIEGTPYIYDLRRTELDNDAYIVQQGGFAVIG